MIEKSTLKIVILLANMYICSTCFAQYVWTDEKGVKQYSDSPPPTSTPLNKILKSPSKINSSAIDSNSSNNNEIKSTEKLQKPITTASKNEDFMKRKSENEEKEKKLATEKQAALDKQKNCERAKSYQNSLAEGIRITKTNSAGERIFLSDEERAMELKEVKTTLTDCK